MLWLVREVEVTTVAYTDTVFKIKKEAETYFNNKMIHDELITLLIKVDELRFRDYDETEFYLDNYDFKIIKRK